MLSKKQMLFITTLALLGFAILTVAISNADDELTTTPAVSSNANSDNASPSPDFDGDGTIGFSDFLLFVDVFGSRQGDEGYEARYDLDGNGTIGFSDFLIFGQHFGKEVSLDDRAVLVALYEATDGPNWTNKENWLSDRPLGEWYGMTTDANGRVTRLELNDNNLQETIPVELAQLTKLTTLELAFNQLTGTIPPELAQLTKLTTLELRRNQLTGTIPTELGLLANLTRLELQGNQLTGTIPTELAQLSSLEKLYLYENQLSGPIPAQLGNLTNLTRLDLAFNQLTGTIPTELAQLTKLTTLYLGGNQLTGTIPTELAQLTKLTTLYLGGNQLTGTIPTELAQLTKLTTLYLGGNPNLSGPLPPEFTDLSLEVLDLEGSGVCVPLNGAFVEWLKSIPVKWGSAHCSDPERDALIALYKQTNGPNWTNKKNWTTPAPLGEWYGVTTDADGRVTELNLRDNNLSGLLPPSLSNLSSLKTLNLADNAALSGPLPQGFTRLSLGSLELEETRLCAPPLAEFQTWVNGIRDSEVAQCTDARPDFYPLVALYSGTDGPNWTNATNWASDALLSEWYGVTTDADGRVTELNLRDNNLQGTIPTELGLLANLKELYLYGNQLTGTIPTELGLLANLKTLDLRENQLTGTIPKELGLLANLTRLALGGNQLTGTIPSELGLLANLEELYLYGNQLTGTIPSELGLLANLKTLDLRGNQLMGTIPTELGLLANLTRLELQRNQLTGTIPKELGQLSNLEELYLYGNQLTGTIPTELGLLANLKTLDLEDNQLMGTIPKELGLLANLETLWIENNTLTGEIPPELGHLTNLTELNLSTNQLSGNIPSELGQLANLTELNLSTNQLSGNIPSELGQLANLTELNLSTNQLSGNIPSELGQLANLKTLNIAFNGTLSGMLPNAIKDLSLESLRLHETLLCSPQDAEFQAWLRAIPFSRVPNCARFDEATAYLTQATQSLEYPVPLVAGEAALLRVFVISERNVEATMPPVRATFYRDGVEVHMANIEGQTTNIPRQINEASLLNSANAVVPGSVVMPGLEMVVEIDPDQTLDPTLGIAIRLPRMGRTALDVRSVPPFELTLIPFLWEENPDRSVVTQTEGLSSESDLFRLTRDILPVSEFRLTVHEPVLTSVDPTSDASDILEAETKLIYAMEGAKGYYMGIFRSAGESGLGGLAPVPGYTSLSILDENIIAHELGHNLNLEHAPGCGAGGPDPEYPNDDGSIGAWGYDFVNKSLVSPATSDLMTYCEPQWISDYSFTRALAHRSQAERAPLAASYTPPTRGLLIWGGLDEDEKPFLEPAFVVSAPPSLPRIDGSYRLTGEDKHGNNLFSMPFGIPEYGCGGKGGAFAFILPVQDDWAGRLARIAFSGPEGVSILDGEGDLSATLLLDRATGNVRGILRDPQTAAKRPAASLLPPEPELEVLTSRGIPDAASYER